MLFLHIFEGTEKGIILPSHAPLPRQPAHPPAPPGLRPNPVPVNIHCDRNRAVVELPLHIGRRHPRHQQDGGASVSKVVRIPALEPGGIAHPFELALNVPLAERPPALRGSMLDYQEIHYPLPPARLQPLFIQGHHVRKGRRSTESWERS